MKPIKINIDKIKNNPDNPRVIKDYKFDKLVKSIEDFPEMLRLRPIVVDENNVILGGNMRYKAAVKAGLEQVYAIQAEDLTDKQKQEFIIKDNSNFGEWDWDILANEWDKDQLDEWGLEIPNYLEMPDETDLVQENKEEKPTLKITFSNFEDLNHFEKTLKDKIEKYDNCFYSVKGWNAT
tara:strand:- start:1741 stop:2280 length:540 start_codon:yes stop_codon:yes gene_type:complete